MGSASFNYVKRLDDILQLAFLGAAAAAVLGDTVASLSNEFPEDGYMYDIAQGMIGGLQGFGFGCLPKEDATWFKNTAAA